MKKTFNLSWLIIAATMSFGIAACGSDDEEEESGQTINRPYTYDSYYDGLLYYQVTSINPNTAMVKKATNAVEVVKIPSTIKIVNAVYSLTEIGPGAFSECYNLFNITIPNSVTSIGHSAFLYCSGLESITIGNSVTSIGDSAFYGCSGLTSIHCECTTPPSIEHDTFSYVIASTTLYVPKGSLNAYRSASYWSQFSDIREE